MLEIEEGLLTPKAASGAATSPAAGPEAQGTLGELERRQIEDTLQRCGWVIQGPGGAAAALGLHPNTLRSRLKRLGIHRAGR